MRIRASVAALLMAGLMILQASADIVPNEPDPVSGDGAARKVVLDRLDNVGVDALQATSIVKKLRPEEARFFAASDTEPVVTGLWLEEWIGAIIYAALLGSHIYDTWYKYIVLNEN